MSKYPIPFGRYLLLERINVGGMAEVFKAKTFGVEGFERIVAIKRILPTLADDDEFVTMFVDEARIAAQLTHQNVVQIYELGRHEQTFYIAMEYVAGKDLRQVLDWQKRQKRPVAVAKACFVISRVCEALDYAHRKKDYSGRDLKIVHRDVTPQNVILSYEGEVKLCDFGIAKAASRASKTQVGVLKGKFAYMSPEQVRGQPTDRRGDLFALGVIFYEMLTGERLFLGDSDYATLEAVRNAVVVPPSQFNDQISPALERVVMKLLARDPKDRYQWASELHEDLLEHLVFQQRPYHGRHLRTWMQEIYGRDIEIENAKLEEFLRLKLPDPEPEEFAADDDVRTVNDPAEGPDDFADPTDHFPVAAVRGGLVTGSPSPVSNLFGDPLVGDPHPEPEEVVVRAHDDSARGRSDPIEDLDESERTQWNTAERGDDANETLYDEEGNETEMGTGRGLEIAAAQVELLSRLEARGVIRSSDFEAPGMGDTVNTVGEEYDDEISNDPTSNTPLDMDEETAGGTLDTPGYPDFPGLGDIGTGPLDSRRYESRTDDVDTSDLARNDERTPGPRPDPRGGPVEVVTAPRASPSLRPRADISESRLRGAVVERGPQDRTPEPRRAPDFAPSAPAALAEPPLWSSLLTHPRFLLAAAGAVALLAAVAIVLLISVRPTTASLSVATTPVSAEVWLDGQPVSPVTPVEVNGLAVGSHIIELRAAGYRLHRQEIPIAEAKAHTMTVPLERAPVEPERAEVPPLGEKGGFGSLLLSTRPSGLMVRIDGEDIGLKTPMQKPFRLSAGKHTVTCVGKDGREFSFDVNIQARGIHKIDKTF